ncbi:MAG TPA: hypothetical protein VG407_05150 [Caulobacteraceae bacterium]|nr:hypothetical protein [Caulobacteraceae bacterium]
MSPPDLSTEEGRAAYKLEVRKAGFWPRQIGFGLVIAAVVALLWFKFGHAPVNPRAWTAVMGVMCAGWMLLIVAILMRSRYRRRLRGNG